MLPWLADILLAVRNDADLSLTEMSARIGVDRTALNRIERGQRWPRRVDDVVNGYATVAEVPAFELWRRALREWVLASAHPDAVALANRL